MAASVWMSGSVSDQDDPGSLRFTADTTPRVSVCSSPSGLPIA
jgi:hypothetical protein